MNIYIVRHGETNANKKGILQGWSDTPLNEKGILLAKKTGCGLANINFDAVFSSPLSRAKETASIIISENKVCNKNIAFHFDERLKEINMGSWEGKCFRGEHPDISPSEVALFLKDPFKLPPFPGGEDANKVIKRTKEFLLELVKSYDYNNVLIVTHGFAIRATLNFLYDDPANFWQGQVPPNCASTHLSYDPKTKKFSFVFKDKIFYRKEDLVKFE